jgi:hypothetical protein
MKDRSGKEMVPESFERQARERRTDKQRIGALVDLMKRVHNCFGCNCLGQSCVHSRLHDEMTALLDVK